MFQGRIRVTSYELLGEESGGRFRFRQDSTLTAGLAEAGALIPPWDYHVIENADPGPAVTIHVYGGEMDGCHAFAPVEGGLYERRWKALGYSR